MSDKEKNKNDAPVSEKETEKPERKIGFDRLSLKTRILILLLVPVLLITVCSVVIVITVHGMGEDGMGGGEEEAAVDISLYSPGTDDAAGYIASMTKDISLKDDVKTGRSISVSFSDVTGDMNEAQKNLLTSFIGQVSGRVKDMYSPKGTEYGEDVSFVAIDPACLTDAKAEFKTDGKKYVCEAEADPEFFEDMLKTDVEVKNSLVALSTDECAITSIEMTLSGVTFSSETPLGDFGPVDKNDPEAGYNSEDMHIGSYSVARKYDVKATIVFSDALGGLGTQNISFTSTVTEKVSFTYMGIRFSKKEAEYTKNDDGKAIGVSWNAPDAAFDSGECVISFESSDPDVVSFDNGSAEMLGVMNIHKESSEPVKITAVMTYRDHVYSDTCEITIKKGDGLF